MPEVAQREARRATIAAGVGTLIEGYDLLIYGYLATVLAGQFFPTEDPATALLNTLAVYAVVGTAALIGPATWRVRLARGLGVPATRA